MEKRRTLLAATIALSALVLTGCPHHHRRPGPPPVGPGAGGPGGGPAGGPGGPGPGAEVRAAPAAVLVVNTLKRSKVTPASLFVRYRSNSRQWRAW